MKKIGNKSICKDKILSKIKKCNSSGITLIALIITIIILLILAGVTINLTLGKNGLFSTTKRAVEDYEKSAIKEEIEHAILDIKIEKLQDGEELTMNILEQNLQNKLKDIYIEKDDEGQITGEYKGYDYTITKDYEVIVESVGNKPVVTYSLSDETIGISELTITLNASIDEGTITKIIKPDETYEENVNTVSYKVTQNGEYKFTVEASNGSKRTKTILITNLKPIAPVIEISDEYPTLSQNGVKVPNVKIVYEENENLEHYYSEDNGANWKIYNGEFTPRNNIIIAKSVIKEKTECYTQVQVNNAIKNDAIMPVAYDGNYDTYMQGNEEERFINIDPTMVGKNVRIKIVSFTGNYGYGSVKAVLSNGTMEDFAIVELGSSYDSIFKIPEDAVKIRFSAQVNVGLYEIQPAN